MKRLKRFLATMLTLTMCVGEVGVTGMTVQAGDEFEKTAENTMFGTTQMASPRVPLNASDSWQGSYVYYGEFDDEPVKYRVLDTETTVYSESMSKTVLLDCNDALYLVQYDSKTNDVTWKNSVLHDSINGDGFYGKEGVFSFLEKNAISKSYKSTRTSSDGDQMTGIPFVTLEGDNVFVLDNVEATNASYGYFSAGSNASSRLKGGEEYWWLRSLKGYLPRAVCQYGVLDNPAQATDGVDFGASPAFNVKLSSILFSSVVKGNKEELNAEYKLTLLTNLFYVEIPSSKKVNMSGSTLDVPYSVGGVNAGDANAISVLILDGVYDTKAGNDNTANILYYGRLAVDGTFSKNGTGSFSLPSALKLDAWGTDYRVYIIPEQINDSTHTDYAGEPVEIKKSDLNIVDITGITLNKDAADLVEGENVVLTATVTPDNASDKSVTWSSDTPAVATVDENGKVTAKKAGTAKITATATNGTDDTEDDKTAVCTVTVIAPKVDVTDIAVDKTATLVKGNTLTLTATVSPEGATDKTVTWTSDTPAVATVDEAGKVTAIKAGTAKITATATNGTADTTDDLKAVCTVTVIEAKVDITDIALDKTASVAEGKTLTLTATVSPDGATDKTVTWISDTPAVATVDEAGKVTAIKTGTAKITATATNGTADTTDDLKAVCTVTVTSSEGPTTDVTGVTLNKETVNLDVEGNTRLIATIEPSDGTDKTVVWTSDNTDVATVNESGVVTAVAAGTAKITATATNGTEDTADDKTATCEVTVTAATEPKTDITGVTLDKAELTVEEGKTETLAATVAPEDASSKDVIWSSSDDTIATIDADGVVVAVKAGTATITVTATNGTEDTADDKSATCEVTVTEAAVKTDITGITLDKTTVSLEVEQIETLTVTVEPEEATDKNVTFKSSDEKIATVDEEGKITAVAKGSTVIIVTADNGTAEADDDKTATCIVTVTAKKTSPEIPAEGTALVKDDQGKQVYYKDGEPQTSYSGLAIVDGEWYYVEKGVFLEDKIGFVEFEGGVFLIVEGKLETGKSGLIQDPYNPETWYFLANGQAQTQYTGLALYDGAWFYVDGGKLNTELADFVEYDSGLFFVGAGRIMKEVSGLAQDPNGPDWYYLAEGQAQTQYTGLAMYDGEWFYVVEGKLAEDYTGTVEYDGSEFNVVSGMVK